MILLLFTDWFDPAYKAGGPIRSVVNLSKALKSEFSIWVFTGDRDHQTSQPLQNIISDQWITYDQNIQVFYSSKVNQNIKAVKTIITQINPDCIYLNSMFSKVFTTFPLRILLEGQISCPVVLAPRGMLKKSALQFKRHKKKIFLQLLKRLRLPQKLHFHATTQAEAQSIIDVFGINSKITVINNLPSPIGRWNPKPFKTPLRFIFVGRIHPIKGLALLLKCLQKVSAPLHLSIIGNKEDLAYWKSCQKLINELPPRIHVEDLSEVPHPELNKILQKHHFFILPTQGENFGHAIFEAFAKGLPVIISDQTPWQDLETQKAGWDLPLSNQDKIVNAIEKAATMTQSTYNQWSQSAWHYAKDFIDQSNIKQQYIELFSQKD